MRKDEEIIPSSGGFDGKKDDFPPRGVVVEPDQTKKEPEKKD